MYRRIRLRMTLTLGALAAMLLFAPLDVAAQGGSITGRVTDSQTGQAVAAAQVFISELDLGGLTRQNGSYLLLNVPIGTHTVTVQRIGFRTITESVTLGAGETMAQNFQITEEALSLDEIIVTGTPGGTQKRAIGNVVTTVDAAAVTERVAIANMQDMLAGRTPGLQFTRLSGNVGTGSSIKIRGVGSFNLSSNPLIYVDGVRVNNQSRAGPMLGYRYAVMQDEAGSTGGEVSVLDDFNPEDIESIEIIKGPAAATLYGTEASAGVIQIITKKGREGAPQFTASVRQGVNFMTDPAGRLGTMYACRNSSSTPCEESNLFTYNMYDEANRYIREGAFPWGSKELFRNGLSSSYDLGVRGGTSNIRYFLSTNYEDEGGVVWYNNDKTFRTRANVSVVFSESVTLDVSTGYVDGNTRFATPVRSDGGVWQDLRWANGYFLDTNAPGANERLFGFQEHLPSDVANIAATRDYSRFTGSATLNHNFGSWLNQRVVVGLDKGWDTNQVIFPWNPAPPPNQAVYSETVSGTIDYGNPMTEVQSLDYSATIDYSPLGFLDLKTSFGAQYSMRRFENLRTQGEGFASPLSRSVNQTPVERLTLTYDYIENKSLGFYVQEQIGWNDRLFLTGAVRFDDNSAFGTDFEAQIYPKFSGTYVVSEESFWNFDLINSLRVRGAWGKAGRQPSVFAATNLWGVIPGPGGTAALRPSSPGNPEVGPEVSTEYEGGFDIAILDDRISGEFTFFRQENKDALLNAGFAPSLGLPGAVQSNVGQIDTWGWEASLNTRVYENDDFSFEINFMGDHTNNEIVDLATFAPTGGIRIGYPFPSARTRYWVTGAEFPAGETRGTPINAMCDPGFPREGVTGAASGRRPGATPIPCADIGTDPILIGPEFYTYIFSIAPTVSLLDNSLQVFAMAQGQFGRTASENAAEWGHIYNNTRISQLENNALWQAADRGRFTDNRTKRYYDGDFWKLRELGARYRLPASLIGVTGAESMSLAVSARNVFTLWQAQTHIYDVQISDPEYGAPTQGGGGNYWNMPPLASLHMTLRVTF